MKLITRHPETGKRLIMEGHWDEAIGWSYLVGELVHDDNRPVLWQERPHAKGRTDVRAQPISARGICALLEAHYGRFTVMVSGNRMRQTKPRELNA